MVTLIPSPGASCGGVAYLVDHDVFEHLDHREKNGYERHPVAITFDGTEGEALPICDWSLDRVLFPIGLVPWPNAGGEGERLG